MKLSRPCSLLAISFVALICLAPSLVLAQKKPGGGGGSTTKPYRLVTLDLSQGRANAMTEAVTANGTTTVDAVGWLGDFAQFWRVSASNAVESVRLTLPSDVDPQSALASAEAINNDGLIVGGCRLIDTNPGQPLLWEDELADPRHLPLPEGFSGFALPRAINNAGVILGELSGELTAGGETVPVEGLIAWLTWRDLNGQIQVSSPTWFPFSTMSKPTLNDQGWVAFVSNGEAVRLRLAHRWVWDDVREEYVSEFYFNGGEGPMFGSDKVAGVGDINQAGDVAGDYRTVNQPGRDVYVKRLDGTFLNMPVYINDRTYGTYVHGVNAVNDATALHAVQALGQVGTYYKKYPNSLGAWYWAIWESGGNVRLLKDITDIPTDDVYDFTNATSFGDMNDASWICGRITRGATRVGVPAVLIRKP